VTVYVDTSALLKRYVAEPDSDVAEGLLLAHARWATARVTLVETRRNLARLLSRRALAAARRAFAADWTRMHVVELDEETCALAADLAEATGARALDALHLAAAQRVGDASTPFLTFDVRQAEAARALGMRVLGA